MAKNSPAPVAPAAMPSLYSNPAESAVDFGDTVVPKIYLMQPLSQLVEAGVAKSGDAVMALSADDTGAQHLIGGPEGRDEFTAIVLDRHRKVINTADGFEYLPDDYVRGPDERDVWVGYNFLVLIPEVDQDVPAKWLLIKTAGAPVFKKINTLLSIHQARGNTDPLAIKVSTTKKTSRGGQVYNVFTVAEAPLSEAYKDLAYRAIERGASLGPQQTAGMNETPANPGSDF